MFTVNVLSSTKHSSSHNFFMIFSRDTGLPAFSNSVCRILNSFLDSSIFFPWKFNDISPISSKSPWNSSTVVCEVKAYARRRMACTFAANTSKSKGLVTKSSPPIFTAITTFILSDAEDIKIIGTWDTLRISPHQ